MLRVWICGATLISTIFDAHTVKGNHDQSLLPVVNCAQDGSHRYSSVTFGSHLANHTAWLNLLLPKYNAPAQPPPLAPTISMQQAKSYRHDRSFVVVGRRWNESVLDQFSAQVGFVSDVVGSSCRCLALYGRRE
jgi:hypothetical protein